MKTVRWSAVLPWIFLPLVLAPVLGLIPRPAGLNGALRSARLALEAGGQKEAASYLARVAVYQPWRDSLWQAAGLAALAGGDAEQARQYLEVAVHNGHITAAGWLGLGDAYRLSGELQAALDAWDRALQSGQPAAEIYPRQIAIRLEQGDHLAAITALQSLIALRPDDPQTRYQLGLLLAAYQPELALTHLLAAVDLDAELTETVRLMEQNLQPSLESENPAYRLVNAGRALGLIDEWELASAAFEGATRINPEYAEAWAFLGEARDKTGQDPFPALERAIALQANSLPANLLLGLNLRRHGQPEQALLYLEKAAEIEPRNPVVQVEIAATLDEQGDFSAALDHYIQATQLAPFDATYWHLLAWYSLQSGTQIEEIGQTAARQALLLNEEDPIALDLMGYSYYLLGDLLTAQRFLHRVLELDASYAPVHLHLALVHLENDERAAAQSRLEQCIALAPGTPAADQAARILEQQFP